MSINAEALLAMVAAMLALVAFMFVYDRGFGNVCIWIGLRIAGHGERLNRRRAEIQARQAAALTKLYADIETSAEAARTKPGELARSFRVKAYRERDKEAV